VTVRHCSSTAEDDNGMSSKHLETSHQRIFDNNRKWVETMKAEDPDFFVKLGSGQNPEYLFVFPKSHLKSH
jgi:carbonic anhydrase